MALAGHANDAIHVYGEIPGEKPRESPHKFIALLQNYRNP